MLNATVSSPGAPGLGPSAVARCRDGGHPSTRVTQVGRSPVHQVGAIGRLDNLRKHRIVGDRRIGRNRGTVQFLDPPGLGLRAMRAPRGSAHEFAAKVVAMPRADLRASGCNLHTMLALLCRIHTARPVCARNHGVGLLDESTVLNNLRHTAICEIRHRPGIVTQLVVVVASNHMVNCAAGAFCTSSGR